MKYSILFLVRYFPFWAVPGSLVLFELGTYYYNRRHRIPFIACYGGVGVLMVTSILWLIFEGYWRAGPIVKRFLEGIGM